MPCNPVTGEAIADEQTPDAEERLRHDQRPRLRPQDDYDAWRERIEREAREDRDEGSEADEARRWE